MFLPPGFPNVGKSSVINSLVGRKVVSVSRTPGHTKYFQTYYLTKTVKLCDCPGLVFPSYVAKQIQVETLSSFTADASVTFLSSLDVRNILIGLFWWSTFLQSCCLHPLWVIVPSRFRSCQASTPWLRCRSLTAQLGTCVRGSHSSLCSSSNIPVYRTATKISSRLKGWAGPPGTCVRVSLLFSLTV